MPGVRTLGPKTWHNENIQSYLFIMPGIRTHFPTTKLGPKTWHNKNIKSIYIMPGIRTQFSITKLGPKTWHKRIHSLSIYYARN